MERRWILGGTLLAMACLSLPGGSWARERPDADPATIAEKCIERASAIADRCSERNAAAAERCVAEIEELLDAGLLEEADNVASRCTRLINRNSRDCISDIRDICRRCVRKLNRLEETELAEQVRTACENAVAQVRQSRDDAVAAIDGALM